MKLEIKIVNSLKKYNEDLLRSIENDTIKRPVRRIVMTPEVFSKIFSPERIKLLQAIHQNNIMNIYQLAKNLNKPYEVVFRNIKYLEGIGVVKIINKNNKKIPHVSGKLSIDFFSGIVAEA